LQNSRNVVHIIDDDALLVETIGLIFDTIGISHAHYNSAETFLKSFPKEAFREMSGCIVCDIRMPGIGGIACQHILNSYDSALPIILITGFADVKMAVDTMRDGAFNFVEKPFRHQVLIDTVQQALSHNENILAQRASVHNVEVAIQRLSKRELSVLDLLVDGHPNKTIASTLNISLRTAEVHRAHILEKMMSKNVAELVKKVMMVRQIPSV